MPRGAQPGERRGGRQKGSRNKRTQAIEAYARSIVEDPTVQAVLLQQAKQGTLPAPVLQMLFYYAYGKPVERIEQSGPGGGPIPYADMTPEQRQQRIQELTARRQGPALRRPSDRCDQGCPEHRRPAGRCRQPGRQPAALRR